MRASKILATALPLFILAFTGCKSSSSNDTGSGGGMDSGVPEDSGVPPDGGPNAGADAEPPDTGPLPCLHDQGGPDNRGCMPGQVCNLSMNPPACMAGKACTTDLDCNICSDRAHMPMESCGHGYKVTSFCDDRHGNVCARSRAPCEACTEDKDCGRPDPVLPVNTPSKCLNYANGEKFCGRSCTLGCPKGFTCDSVTQQCKRDLGMGTTATCDADTKICPPKVAGQQCTGADQICTGQPCGGTDGYCDTNDLPGALGICIKYCTSDTDCMATPATPTCNRTNGVCIAGCTPGSCAAGQTCHLDGMCKPPCNSNMDCEMRFGANTYCNLPGQPPPDIYKPSYRDPNSCAPKGCEMPIDCMVAGRVCDKAMDPPACVEGCFTNTDCTPGEVCKSTGGAPRMMSYTREQCRALATKTDMNELGVCCNPGCTNRNLQCAIHQFCCGETGSPYEDPATCLTLTATSSVRAVAGDCFDMPAHPFCGPPCDIQMMNCMSGFMPGFNTDPNINGGMPFNEQEFCISAGMNGPFYCTTTCNEAAIIAGGGGSCPRGWPCGPVMYSCFQDADCGNGLTCVGAMPQNMPPIPGKCKCGANGMMTAACPNMNNLFYNMAQMITHPRCVAQGMSGDMFCVASYSCQPPPIAVDQFPMSCFQ
jgi:hypothetical protein